MVTANFSPHDLSSFILKNDISQLVLGICEMTASHRKQDVDQGDMTPSSLDWQFTEQNCKTLLHLAVQSNSLAAIHCLIVVSRHSATAIECPPATLLS